MVPHMHAVSTGSTGTPARLHTIIKHFTAQRMRASRTPCSGIAPFSIWNPDAIKNSCTCAGQKATKMTGGGGGGDTAAESSPENTNDAKQDSSSCKRNKEERTRAICMKKNVRRAAHRVPGTLDQGLRYEAETQSECASGMNLLKCGGTHETRRVQVISKCTTQNWREKIFTWRKRRRKALSYYEAGLSRMRHPNV
jgi:hypothetical protein